MEEKKVTKESSSLPASEESGPPGPPGEMDLPSISEYARIIGGARTQKKWPTHPGMIAEEVLTPQIGTFPDIITETGRYDDRILSRINSIEALWMSIVELIPEYGGGRMWKKFGYVYRMLKRSEGGWTTQNIIKALGNLRGSPMHREIARKPNILARNLWNRDWREKATEEGKEVIQ